MKRGWGLEDLRGLTRRELEDKLASVRHELQSGDPVNPSELRALLKLIRLPPQSRKAVARQLALFGDEEYFERLEEKYVRVSETRQRRIDSWVRRVMFLVASRIAEGRVRPISRPVGSRLLPLVRIIFGAKTTENVFEQTVLDMREEYHDALDRKARWEARFARLRGYWAFIAAAGAQSLGSLVKLVWGVLKRAL